MNPIYTPRGAAKEYGDYCVNIYTGCPHRCYYCYAPRTLHIKKEEFHSHVEPRKELMENLWRQLEREQITGRLIHLCFTCDPYPVGRNTYTTREVIKALKAYGNHVQILTKGNGSRDFDLLDGEDWYGVTISCNQPMADTAEPCAESPASRLYQLEKAKTLGIKTWVSFEPVLDVAAVLDCIKGCAYFIDRVRIGKLNYHPSSIDWAQFGREAEAACREMDLDYYIKDGLRAEMTGKAR